MTLFRFLAFLCLIFTATFADEPVQGETEKGETAFAESFEDEEEEEEKIVSSPDVTSSSLFPRYPNDELPLAARLELLFAVENHGAHTFTVNKIRGSLRYAPDPSFILQNFTSHHTTKSIVPGTGVSFTFWLDPDPLLEPRDYVLDASVDYFDEDNVNYTTTVYNKTVIFVEGESEFDLNTVFSYLLTSGFAGLVFFAIYNFTKNGAKSKKEKKAQKNKAPVDNDWTTNSNMKQYLKQSEKSTKK